MKKHDLRGRLVYKRKSSARRFCAAAEIDAKTTES
jgi:hypothetical protein